MVRLQDAIGNHSAAVEKGRSHRVPLERQQSRLGILTDCLLYNA